MKSTKDQTIRILTAQYRDILEDLGKVCKERDLAVRSEELMKREFNTMGQTITNLEGELEDALSALRRIPNFIKRWFVK